MKLGVLVLALSIFTAIASAQTTSPLWQEPKDIRSRDLRIGAGGLYGAPDIDATWTQASTRSSQLVLQDNKGRNWIAYPNAANRSTVPVSRILWAAGYHTVPVHFRHRVLVGGRHGRELYNVTLVSANTPFADWWTWNAAAGQGRTAAGAVALMALLNNLSHTNENPVVRDKIGGETWLVALPSFALGRQRLLGSTNGDAKEYESARFIRSVEGDVVRFACDCAGTRFVRVTPADAHWISRWLSQISEQQLRDAFDVAAYQKHEIDLFVTTIQRRIRELAAVAN